MSNGQMIRSRNKILAYPDLLFNCKEESMRTMVLLFALISFLLTAMAAYAQNRKLSDEAEFSYINTGGNTDVETLKLNNKLVYLPLEQWKATWNVNTFLAKTDGEKTGEIYGTDLRLDYLFTERFYSFGLLAWLQDEFAGLEDRYYLSLGTGYAIIAGPKHTLKAETGLNHTIEEFTDGTDNSFTGARLYAQYVYLFTDKNNFSAWAEYLHDFEVKENYNANAGAALISALNGFLSLKSSYMIKYDNEPAPGATETDTIVSVTLVMNLV
jgi:putative salt-induced outer membrane protein